MKFITILGATGSVGVNTLNVIQQHPERFKVVALTAHQNSELLYKQCLIHQPEYAVVSTPALAHALQQRLQHAGLVTQVLFGNESLERVASLKQIDTVMAAIVGAAGLYPTLAAIKAKKQVLLANKESLVMAGSLFIKEARQANVPLLPVDSEHNAIFQCLQGQSKNAAKEISRVILTASGGGVKDVPLNQLSTVTPRQACQHPNWSMGQKITVDSATLMNKGFEVIEAYFLFGLALNQIEVILHPQSIIHSLVEYRDGSLLAQLGMPDMRIPISYVLGWPERIENAASRLDLLSIARLDFKPIDTNRYPCLNLAIQALELGGTATTILNAANEVTVQAFLDEKIRFTDIAHYNQQVLQKLHSRPAENLAVIVEDDQFAREIAIEMIQKNYGSRQDAVIIETYS